MIEFDMQTPAAFNPQNLHLAEPYRRAVLIFDDEVWEDYVLPQRTTNFIPVKNNRGRVFTTYQECEYNNEKILLVYPNTGAAAAVMDLELLIASGIEEVIVFGTCGVFDAQIPENTIIIPTEFIREEGTSYHYLPKEAIVKQSLTIVQQIQTLCEQQHLTNHTGKVWTIDAIYRETLGKIARYRQEGCVAIDMEMSALFAVAQYRKIKLAGFLIADDLVLADKSRPAPLLRSSSDLLNLALEIVTQI